MHGVKHDYINSYWAHSNARGLALTTVTET